MLFFSSITGDLFEILFALIVLVLGFSKPTFEYWKNLGVHTPKVIVPFGNALDIIFGRYTTGDVWKNYYNLFKQNDLPFGGIYLFSRKFFIPTDPELIKCILQRDFHHFINHSNYVNEENDPLSGHLFSLKDMKWRNLRIKLTPTFTTGKMKMMFGGVASCAEELRILISENALNNTPIDIKEVLNCFFTDIIGSCAFGIDCNSLKNPNSEFRKYSKNAFEITFRTRLHNMLQFVLPDNVLDFIKYKVTKKDVEEFFLNMTRKTVEFREKNNIYRKDFMHLLIQLKNLGMVTDDDRIVDGGIKEKGLSIKELAAQAFMFFVAGFETSSATLSFALYELALNEDIQKKLRNEIEDVLQDHNGTLTYEALIQMQYLDKIIKETLRKYPSAPIISRKCNKNYPVPNSNLILEKDTCVVIPILGLHYDHEYYPNPIVFDPERFTKENNQARPANTWLPFGNGPRLCIGFRFGLMQIKVGLVTLIKNFQITINKKTTVPLIFDTSNFFLNAKDGIYLNVKKIT